MALIACSEVDRNALVYGDADEVAVMHATLETTAVKSSDDAADDPAIWIHPVDAGKSLVIGTDKQAGLAVYNLAGEQIQFLERGLPNNVDIRQNLLLGEETVDLAAYSDRETNTVGWVSITENGIEYMASFPAQQEPYGFCLGHREQHLYAFVTYKTGLIEKYEFLATGEELSMPLVASYKLDSQLEGCVYNDASGDLFVGEEETGIWKFATTHDNFAEPDLIDSVGSSSGIAADVEGVSIYFGEHPMLVVSSQGNDSYALYDLAPPHRFVKRFRIITSDSIDGAQETDGLDLTAVALPGFPRGLLVVQDGFNDDGYQNFKFVHADFESLP